MNKAQEHQFSLALWLVAAGGLVLMALGMIVGDQTQLTAIAVGFGFFSIACWGEFLTDLKARRRVRAWIASALGVFTTTGFALFATRSPLFTVGTCTLVPLIVIALLLRSIKPDQS